jgi:hypothetical protein
LLSGARRRLDFAARARKLARLTAYRPIFQETAMLRAALPALFVLLAIAIAAPAEAQSRRELQMRLDNLEARLAQL